MLGYLLAGMDGTVTRLADFQSSKIISCVYDELPMTMIAFLHVSVSVASILASQSTGKERDNETGLDFFFARYYSAAQGRFMTPDWSTKPEPVPYASLDKPQSLNLYGYVLNNPLSNFDPDGHKVDCSGKKAEGAGCKSLLEWYAEHGVLSDESKEAIMGSSLTIDQQKSFIKAVEKGADRGNIDPNILVGMAKQESDLGRVMDGGLAKGLYGIQDGQRNQINKMFKSDITTPDLLSLSADSMLKVSTGVGKYLGRYVALYSNWTDPNGIDIALSFWRIGAGQTRANLRGGKDFFWNYVDPNLDEPISRYTDTIEAFQK
jgi:RHS repeat-associated protein